MSGFRKYVINSNDANDNSTCEFSIDDLFGISQNEQNHKT